MAIHSSILEWKIRWTGWPGELQPMESKRVRHDLVTKPPLVIPSPLTTLTMNYEPCLEWPCTAWLIASLSYTSPFAMTKLIHEEERIIMGLQ